MFTLFTCVSTRLPRIFKVARSFNLDIGFRRLNKMSEFVIPNTSRIAFLDCQEAFNGLAEKEKLYTHYLSRASSYGGLIVLLQTSVESPIIYNVLQKLFSSQSLSSLKEVAVNECGFSDEDFKSLLAYASGVYGNMGNYKGFGDTKFVPNVDKEKLEKLFLASEFGKRDSATVKKWLSKCFNKMFSLKDSQLRLGFPSTGVTAYFSKNVSKEDVDAVNAFATKKNMALWNTRLFKTVDESGLNSYEIRLASVLKSEDEEEKQLLSSTVHNGHKFTVTRGDYGQLLDLVNKNLQLAKEHAANDYERKMIEYYMKSFHTGSIEDHIDGSRWWIKDKGPIIESYIGFIENYRDPAGIRGEFEGFVAVVNKKLSEKFTVLSNAAEKFIALLPWPSTYEKDKFLLPDFTTLDIVTFAGSTPPIGINIPNYDNVRQNEGFKNVELGNIIRNRSNEPPNYLSENDIEVFMKYLPNALELSTALHELLGHGCGKLFQKEEDGSFNFDIENVRHLETNEKISSWYEHGESFSSKFGALNSPYEECRADCVALYLFSEPEIQKIFGHEDEKVVHLNTYTEYICKCLSGLAGMQCYDPKQGKWLQAHCQGCFVILRVLTEGDDDFVRFEKVTGKDGNPDLRLTVDPERMNTVGKEKIGKFLRRLQLYKSIGDFEAGKEMFMQYSAVVNEGKYPFLEYRDIVMARKKPRAIYNQANTYIENGKVQLKTYDSSFEGLIQSWVERFQGEENVYDILEELCEKDKTHFC